MKWTFFYFDQNQCRHIVPLTIHFSDEKRTAINAISFQDLHSNLININSQINSNQSIVEIEKMILNCYRDNENNLAFLAKNLFQKPKGTNVSHQTDNLNYIVAKPHNRLDEIIDEIKNETLILIFDESTKSITSIISNKESGEQHFAILEPHILINQILTHLNSNNDNKLPLLEAIKHFEKNQRSLPLSDQETLAINEGLIFLKKIEKLLYQKNQFFLSSYDKETLRKIESTFEKSFSNKQV